MGVDPNWGRPSAKTFGPGTRDQYTVQPFNRRRLLQQLAITPHIEFLIDPALNRGKDVIAVSGVRLRPTL